MTLFGRHRVRATFYHIVSIVFIIQLVLYLTGIMSTEASLYLGMFLFIVDYLAEMYDPNPENPGPWFKSHFHRFFDGEVEEDLCELTIWIAKREIALDKAYDSVIKKCSCCFPRK